MSRFNYILNDLAFYTFVIKCLYGEPTDEDLEICENQIKLLHQEYKQLKEQVQDLKADYGTIAQIERDFYKEVIEEVREYVNYLHNNCKYRLNDGHLRKLKQILDKCKEA